MKTITQKTKKCINGTFRVFTTIKVNFGKTELIHACIKKHKYESEYTEPKTASELIKWARDTYDVVARYDVLTAALEDEFHKFEDLAVASVNRLFPELRDEEYENWYTHIREDDE